MSSHFGLYLHIPFCRSKCAYCDFPSFANMDEWQAAVVGKMQNELTQAAEEIGNRQPTTVYIGGGTPSVLAPDLFRQLLSNARRAFPWRSDSEVSVEMNPGTITDAFLESASESWINRISIGAQSTSDRLLKLIGRIHSGSDIREAVLKAKKHGFSNINLDMMIGLPEQTMEDVAATLEDFIALEPTHISCYSLILEDGTKLSQLVSKGQLRLPEDSLEREMYYYAREQLETSGYHQYEISNFAKSGFECRHNLDCWNREEYLGIGVAAASFIGEKRIRNPETIASYLEGTPPEVISLTEEDAKFESIMLGLRLTQGISDSDFKQRHGVSLIRAYGEIIESLVKRNLLEWNDGHLRCTKFGMDIQNEVLTEFMD